MNKRGIRILIFLAIVAIIAGVWMLFKKDDNFTGTNSYGNLPAPKEYTYLNDTYNFSLKVPAGWSVFETKDGPNSVITFYKNKGQSAPDNYLENSTHFSVLPAGSQIGGVIMWESRVDSSQKNNTTTEYILEDGTVWSKKLEFSPVPESWQNWGFAFASLEVQEESQRCVLDGKEIPIRECDPFSGAVLKRDGNISESDKKDIEKILKSFTIK